MKIRRNPAPGFNALVQSFLFDSCSCEETKKVHFRKYTNFQYGGATKQRNFVHKLEIKRNRFWSILLHHVRIFFHAYFRLS